MLYEVITRQRLRDLSRALPKPEQILAERRQRLDAVGERLPLALKALTTQRRVGLERVGGRLSPRITSYNVCYTKLLRMSNAATAPKL